MLGKNGGDVPTMTCAKRSRLKYNMLAMDCIGATAEIERDCDPYARLACLTCVCVRETNHKANGTVRNKQVLKRKRRNTRVVVAHEFIPVCSKPHGH